MRSMTMVMLALLAVGVCRSEEPLPEPLKACVSMRHDAERLACYDQAVALIKSGNAGAQGPSAENMFGANSNVAEAPKAAGEPERQELKEIRGQVASLHRTGDGMIVLTLDN